jgi:hypothetical protein
MDSQTVKMDQWLVVDDGFDPIPVKLRTGMEYVRRTPSEGEGHTLVANLTVALPLIKGDKILIIEDDDWYGPNYIKMMSYYLNTYDLVGEGAARYYFAPLMLYRRIHNRAHASLCQTGFTKKILPILEGCLPGNPYVDVRIWEAVKVNKYVFMDENDTRKLHCSMKGLKGRKGIGEGHIANARNIHYQLDNGLNQLITWVGEENARIYMDHVGQSFESARINGVGRNAPIRRPSLNVPMPVSVVKEEGITVITCTGDRPESFELLCRWMKNQTLRPNQWIIVDDGKNPLSSVERCEYYRREPSVNDFPHTLCLNMLVALEHVSFEKVIIMEDDDWYHPTYIDYMSKLLDTADLVGFRNLMFYYPSTGKYMVKGSARQPALAQTAFRKTIIPVVQDICKRADKEWQLSGKGLIDAFLWAHTLDYKAVSTRIRLTTALKIANGTVVPRGTVFNDPFPVSIVRRANKKSGAEFFTQNVSIKGTKMLVACDTYLSVGMKGMPGRKGLTTQHEISNQRYKIDAGHNLLKSILKSDAFFYMKNNT